ncbi:TPA: beta strand repeat-containing protein, partial [Haemophilus influenzae]
GETYLGGDERGEGKNGIQLAKKTTLEKGSTINVSGKEKGGRAIVWGDIALIDGNINAQGKDIAKTGGFVETSGHYLSIDSNAIVKTKEWLLDPDNVTIEAPSAPRTDDNIDSEFLGDGTENNPKVNNQDKTILTNTTISNFLKNAQVVNITAKNKITVNSSINIGANSNLTLWSEGQHGGGVKINGDITSTTNGNLTIHSGGWVDVHKNITLGTGFLNITSGDSVAFESENTINKNRRAADAQITAQGTIRLTGENKTFRLNNVSLNGTGNGLKIISIAGNLSHRLDGEINISGNVTINQTSNHGRKPWETSHRSYWNVSNLNLAEGAVFTFTKRTLTNRTYPNGNRDFAGVEFNGLNGNMSFNVAKGARVIFNLKPSEFTGRPGVSPYEFKSNITALGGGSVLFDITANLSGRGAELKMDTINISGGTNFTLQSQVRGNDAFKITKDLAINATGSNFTLQQSADSFQNGFSKRAINTTRNLTLLGGNITLGGQNSSSDITGNITIKKGANATLQSRYSGKKWDFASRTTTLGNLTVEGSLNLVGTIADIKGNLSILQEATFKGETSEKLSIAGTFTNNGTAEINISQGVVNLGNITNNKSLSITTNAKNGQKSIIHGDITNNKGALNITNNGNETEIQISGNISQKEGNLTISSDKINITKRIEIKAGTDQGNSDSGVASNANLTIKTKELKLTENLNISGFDKAEIVAKENNNLIIGNNNGDNANAKTVTFNNVKDSKISANGHNVTLNSKVETSDGNSNTEGNSDNNAGLTIDAKNVTVNNDITSHKTVNITASERIDTKADTTINATTGNVKLTAVTSDIQGGIKSNSGDVNITTSTGSINGKIESSSGSVTLTATGETLTVGNISGNAVTITANDAKLTTQAGSTINGTNGVTTSSQSGDIGGTISGNTVNVTASTGDLTVGDNAKIEATQGSATLTATKGSLTTKTGSSITSASDQVNLSAQNGSIAGSINAANVTLNTTGTLTTETGSYIKATSGALVINAKDAKLDGEASGNSTVVNATNASGSGNVTAKTSSSVNITGDLNTINGLNIISENGRNTVRLRGKEIDVKYIQPGVASVEEVIEAKRVLEKVKDLSDEERETLAKLGVSAVRFVEPNNTITVNTQNEFTTRPSSQVIISEDKACFSSG